MLPPSSPASVAAPSTRPPADSQFSLAVASFGAGGLLGAAILLSLKSTIDRQLVCAISALAYTDGRLAPRPAARRPDRVPTAVKLPELPARAWAGLPMGI